MEKINEQKLSGPIVATSDLPPMDVMVTQLEQRVRDLEAALDDLRMVKAEGASSGRKTVAAGAIVSKGEKSERSSVDAAFGSLSIEQRIAVKSGLMRAGLL